MDSLSPGPAGGHHGKGVVRGAVDCATTWPRPSGPRWNWPSACAAVRKVFRKLGLTSRRQLAGAQLNP
jgi:hypothetical protein